MRCGRLRRALMAAALAMPALADAMTGPPDKARAHLAEAVALVDGLSDDELSELVASAVCGFGPPRRFCSPQSPAAGSAASNTASDNARAPGVASGAARLDQARIVVLDEADQMLDLGFMPAIRKIMGLVPARRQTALFSETLPTAIPALAARVLPGQLLNVAAVVHGEEALLAVGFIFIFHYFHNRLRPENFPMDITIFTVRLPLERFREERPEQYQRLVREDRLQSVLVGPPSRLSVWLWTAFGAVVVLVGLALIVSVIITMAGGA